MKLKRLQKALIKKCLILLGVFSLVFAGYYFIYNYKSSLSDEVSTLTSQANVTESEVRKLETDLASAKDAIKYYENFSTSSDGNAQNFRRDYAKSTLATIRDRNSIFDIKFSMEPFNKVGGNTERKTAALYVSKVTVQFTAGTDLDVYNLMKDITETFPGNVEIRTYRVNQENELDDATLLAIGQGNSQGLINGDITFEWQAIQDNHDYKKTNEAPTPNSGMPGRPPGMNPRIPGGPPNG